MTKIAFYKQTNTNDENTSIQAAENVRLLRNEAMKLHQFDWYQDGSSSHEQTSCYERLF
jgi:hypothetical protein